jgi:feruloyl esterase
MTDMGHNNQLINVNSLSDFSFAYNNCTAELNFATLSTHLTTVMGKAIAKAYYGVPVQYSYFVGGSTGGT